MDDEQFQDFISRVMKSIRDLEDELGVFVYVTVATGRTDDNKSYVRIENDGPKP